MKNFTLLLIILCFGETLAQKKDSLENELRKLTTRRSSLVTDTLKIRILMTLPQQKEVSWEEGKGYLRQAEDLVEKIDWPEGRLEVYQGMGRHYVRKGQSTDAIAYFYKGLHLAEQQNNLAYQSECYRRIGGCYALAKDTTNSIKVLKKAVEIAQKGKLKKLVNKATLEIGNLYALNKNYDKAEYYYQECLKQNSPVDSTFQSWILVNLADIYRVKAQPYQAILYFNQLLSAYSKFLNDGDKAVGYSHLALAYVQLNKPKQALENAQLASKHLNDGSTFYVKAMVYESLAEVYQLRNQLLLSLEYWKKYKVNHDSILIQEQQQQVENQKISYENEQRKSEIGLMIKLMNAEKRNNLFLRMGLLCFVIITLLTFLIIRRLGKQNKLILKQKSEINDLNQFLTEKVEQRTQQLTKANAELQNKIKEIETAQLKGQTIERQRVAAELHDNLGGTLAAIKWTLYAMENKEMTQQEKSIFEEVLEMVSRAYGEVRLLSHNYMPAILENEGIEGALDKLINQLNVFQRFKIQKNINLVSDILSKKQQFELYSIIVELLTNILKHAQASNAILKLEKQNNNVILTLEDNGVGFEKTLIAKEGAGFQNIRNRLAAINGQVQWKTEVGKGTTVLVFLNNSSLLQTDVEDSQIK